LVGLLKFPPRRALGVRELFSINKFLISSFLHGKDPGYSGKIHSKFKEKFLQWYGTDYGNVEVTGSGTNAIYITLLGLELPLGSTIHVSPITDPGTLSAIIVAGYKVNILDSDPSLFGQTSIESLRSNVTSSSSAVLLVHHAGWPGNLNEFSNFCKSHSLILIEDFSQAMGAIVNGRFVGQFGKVGVASTMYRKALTTGGSGGIIYTDDFELFKNIVLHKDRGKPAWNSNFSTNFIGNRDGNNVSLPALNHNQDDLNIAWGIASLQRLPRVIRKRQQLVKYLLLYLNDQELIPQGIDQSSPFIIPISFASLDLKRIAVEILSKHSIPFNPDYKFNVAMWDWVKPYLDQTPSAPNATEYLSRTLFLYINESYKFHHMKYIALLLNQVN
tara:strand:- start:8923 stop:10083 length:1161 start_codon:yes stop_codon:yes gene_type:complete